MPLDLSDESDIYAFHTYLMAALAADGEEPSLQDQQDWKIATRLIAQNFEKFSEFFKELTGEPHLSKNDHCHTKILKLYTIKKHQDKRIDDLEKTISDIFGLALDAKLDR